MTTPPLVPVQYDEWVDQDKQLHPNRSPDELTARLYYKHKILLCSQQHTEIIRCKKNKRYFESLIRENKSNNKTQELIYEFTSTLEKVNPSIFENEKISACLNALQSHMDEILEFPIQEVNENVAEATCKEIFHLTQLEQFGNADADLNTHPFAHGNSVGYKYEHTKSEEEIDKEILQTEVRTSLKRKYSEAFKKETMETEIKKRKLDDSMAVLLPPDLDSVGYLFKYPKGEGGFNFQFSKFKELLLLRELSIKN